MNNRRNELLHILKSEPDPGQRRLMEGLSAGRASREYALYGDNVDYEELIDLIFRYDRVITWW